MLCREKGSQSRKRCGAAATVQEEVISGEGCGVGVADRLDVECGSQMLNFQPKGVVVMVSVSTTRSVSL